MITTKEFLRRYRRILMAIQETGREKQVNIQVEDLTKTVAALKEVANRLETSLGAVLSPERETEGQDKNPEGPLCEHASYLRSVTSDITTVTCDLVELIRRLEI